ncbi:MAG TPA: nucleoside-diphosphate kinase [Candidatus Hydrogenedentes bacterium]|nr:nucleoside-diphosphate kinase [Candidatus Hydrogenedentota bacterium]
MTEPKLEQTLVLIKPDALNNSLTGYVLSQYSEFHTGLRFAGAKIVNVTRMLAEEHYAEHRGKPFFFALSDYIRGKVHYPNAPDKRRVIALVFHGRDAIRKVREIAGPTNPHQARDTHPGCIRALGTVVPVTDESGKIIADRLDNLIHASATPPEAEREIKLWFRPVDIPPLMRIYPAVLCQEHFYFKAGELFTEHEVGSTLLMAPGEIVWQSDLEVVQAIAKGQPAAYTLQAVAAKYLINALPEND